VAETAPVADVTCSATIASAAIARRPSKPASRSDSGVVAQRVVRPSAPLVHLVDERLVPQVDPVRDHAEVHHRPQLQEPTRDAAVLPTEHRGHEEAERGEAVEELAQVRLAAQHQLEVLGQPDPEREGVEGQRGEQPPEPVDPADALQGRDGLVARFRPGAHDREPHAEREQVEVGGEPEVAEEREGRVSRHAPVHDGPPSDADRVQHDEHRHLQPEPRLSVAAGAEPAHQRGVERQEDVEAHLDHERPRLRDAAERAPDPLPVDHDVAGVVEVHEEEVREQAATTGDRQVHPDEQRNAGERNPVRRIDAQEAVPRVGAHIARRPVGECRGDHRPVQQEARDEEEDLHADVHVREIRADRNDMVRERDANPALVERRRERGVVQHDEQRGRRAQPVEAGKALVGGDGHRAHRVALTIAAAAAAATVSRGRRAGG
jgi:hypothetical protein